MRPGKKRNLVVLVWSVIFAVATLGVIGTAVVLGVLRGRSKSDARSAATRHVPPREVRVPSRFPSPGEEEALTLVKRAVVARDSAAVETCFRLDGTSPSAAVMFLEGMSRNDGPIVGYKWIGSMDKNGLLIDAVLVNSRQGDSNKYRFALLTPDETGVWKTDFHAFARTCVPAWAEIMKEDSMGGMVRVFLEKDIYYNGRFSSEKVWSCHQLLSPDGGEHLLGYCLVDSPQHTALKRILRDNAATGLGLFPASACLEIRRVKGAEARQFEITRVLAEGWVMSANHFDGQDP